MSEPSVSLESPWLGLEPFREEDRRFFFGRNREIEELFAALRHQQLTILFGRSGNGKTSLLKAGLLPVLREKGLLPVVVRLDFLAPGTQSETNLVAQTISAISRAIGDAGPKPIPTALGAVPSFWEWAHDVAAGLGRHDAPNVILIFDQFEELFTLGRTVPKQVQAFIEALAALVENVPPPDLRSRLESDRSLLDRYDFDGIRCRVLISIRADFLSELERYRKIMPSLGKGRYQIELLTGHQTLDAVYRPGTLRSGDDPIIPLEIAEQIVRRVARANEGTPLEDLHAVPPLVSLFCSGINTKRLQATDETKARVTAELVQACGDQILPDFYTSAFADVPSASVVRAMIEDLLVTDAGFRQSLPLPDAVGALQKMGLAQGDAERALSVLEDHRLLAVEAHEGSRRVELIHDLLLDEVRKSRSERKRQEAESLAAHQKRRIAKTEALLKLLLTSHVKALADDPDAKADLLTSIEGYYEHLEEWERDAKDCLLNRATLLRLQGEERASAKRWDEARPYFLQACQILQQVGDAAATEQAVAATDLALRQVDEQIRLSSDRARIGTYDLYFSYARRDDMPQKPGDLKGWVSALRDEILTDHARFSTEPLRVFFDTAEISSVDDWRHRTLEALRRSRILVVFLSPNYLSSEYCRMEWEECMRRQAHALMGSETIAAVFLVDIPATDFRGHGSWCDALMRWNFVDFRPFFAEGLEAFRRNEVRERIAALGISIWERIQRARRATSVPGNLRRLNPHFVGRRAELRQLHENLALGKVGRITALHGLGGVGKTELATAYAHAWADSYPAGLWVLSAEGKRELLPLLGELCAELQIPLTTSSDETGDARGRRVLAELKRHALEAATRDPDKGGACLVILDNVSDPALLAEPQLAHIPREDWLRIVVTTREGPDKFPASRQMSPAFVAVDALPEDDAARLIEDLQLDGQWPAATAAADSAAAREIVRELGGFPLALELAGNYLGLHPDIRPRELLTRLKAEGLLAFDAIAAQQDVASDIRHREKQLRQIVGSNLARLTPAERMTLNYAALLPADQVVWPWLRALVAQDHPNAFVVRDGQPDSWLALRRRLEGLRLLIPSDNPEIARMHRLVGSRIQSTLSESETDACWSQLIAVAYANSGQISETLIHDQSGLWVLVPLREFALHALRIKPEQTSVAELCLGVADAHMNVGEVTGASELLQGAISTFERRLSLHPEDAQTQRAMLVALSRLADFHAQRGLPGDAEQALMLYQRSLEVSEYLAAATPESAQTARDVSVSLTRLADFLARRGQPGDAERALANYLHSLEVNERLLSANPESAETARDVSVSLTRLADFLASRGQPGDAEQGLAYYLRSLEVSERLMASNPNSAQSARDVSVGLNKLADFLASRGLPGDEERALANYQRSLELSERLLASNPESAQSARDTSVSLNKLGKFLSRKGQPGDVERAMAYFERSQEITERLHARNPDSASGARDLAVSLSNLGSAAEAMGHLERAQAAFERALAITERMSAADPTNANWSRDLSVLLARIGDVAVARGDLMAARGRFERSLTIVERLVATDPDSVGWLRDLWVALARIGDLEERQGDLVAARRRYDHVQQIIKRLATLNPADPSCERDYARCLLRSAQLATADGRLAEPENLHAMAVAVHEHLAHSFPGDASQLQDLVIAHFEAAKLAGLQQNQEKTISHLGRSLGLLDELARSGHLSPSLRQLREQLGAAFRPPNTGSASSSNANE